MPDVLVAEIILDRAGIVTVTGQLVARGMAKHVRMHLERQLGLLPGSFDHVVEAFRGEWSATLGDEYECRLRRLVLTELA